MGTSPTVLAMLAVALLAAGIAAARPSGADDDTIIRLPSSGAAARGRPWECCDWVERHPTFRPPKWRCNDVADKCSPNCHKCKKTSTPVGDGYVCRDWIVSLLEPPVCTPRPWDCCDHSFCNKRLPPTCQCMDKVESCPSNCKECEVVMGSDPPLYRCLDSFDGFPGPKCNP